MRAYLIERLRFYLLHFNIPTAHAYTIYSMYLERGVSTLIRDENAHGTGHSSGEPLQLNSQRLIEYIVII